MYSNHGIRILKASKNAIIVALVPVLIFFIFTTNTRHNLNFNGILKIQFIIKKLKLDFSYFTPSVSVCIFSLKRAIK